MARLSTLKIELLADGRSARLLTPYRVRTEDGVSVDVPAGFETDFASVPRFFWRIVPPFGRYSPAAVVHDFLYFSGQVSRKDADETFYRLMGSLGVPDWKRWAMYYAVRAFGWIAWNEHRKRKGLGLKPTGAKR